MRHEISHLPSSQNVQRQLYWIAWVFYVPVCMTNINCCKFVNNDNVQIGKSSKVLVRYPVETDQFLK
ncbi:hypothetical protein RN001_006203 [Aquatica leii]|uniref:Uncharacterized protein n=1 Tax=Aquatica leii TaxID=1421715 RepID=A0AAN7SJM8_9COLE|nr:hypothetical protein RN001_006203 [Aquatica leii]